MYINYSTFFFCNYAKSQSMMRTSDRGSFVFRRRVCLPFPQNKTKITELTALHKEGVTFPNVCGPPRLHRCPDSMDFMGVYFSGPTLTVEGIRKATKALWIGWGYTIFPTIIERFNRMKRNFAFLPPKRPNR